MPSAHPIRNPRAALLGGLLAALAGCGQAVPAAAPRATPVRVEAAGSGPPSAPISATGVVVTKDEIRLSFKVAGVIRHIAVEEGQAVKQGDRLAEIELAEIGSQVEQARQVADKARRDLERAERLYADEVISLEQLEDLRTQAAVARAGLDSANFNLGLSVITAPRDGVVLRKLAVEHELVPAGQAVLVVGPRDRGYIVRAGLADREIVQVRLGDPVEIRMDAFPGLKFPATVTELASAADERTGLFAIEARLASQPDTLVSGLVAKLEIEPASARGTALTYVPIGALVEGDHSLASVFVIDGERARRRAVRVAFITAHGVAIASGLAVGERVVTDGALYLEDGERIAIVRDAAQPTGSIGAAAPHGRG